MLADDVARVQDRNQDLLRSNDQLSRECRVLRDTPIGGGTLAELQEIRELRDEVQQYRGDGDALRRELRRSREEVTERAHVEQRRTSAHKQGDAENARIEKRLSQKSCCRPAPGSSTTGVGSSGHFST